MALDDFPDQDKEKRSNAEKMYLENKDEAWEEIKEFFTRPTTWIVAGIALLLIIAGVFTVKFIGAVRAPDVPGNNDLNVIGDEEPTPGGESGLEEIDDSNTVQPLLTGERKEDYYTFLLVGTDKGGGNTDTIMVVSYDVKNQKLNLMSIPRDTMVNVSWDIKKINSVYSISGIKGLKKHISKLIGFTPDYYVKIDLNAFVEVVDLIGGVEFDVPISMHYHDPAQDLNIDLEPGLQTLNGEQAMGLVRFRKSDRGANGKMTGYDDTGRIQTQQAFLKAMFKQCLQIKNWTKITGYVEIFEKNVESDLTLGNMLWFARQAMNLSEDGFNTCTIPGNYYASAWSYSTRQMQSYVTLYGQQVIQLVNADFNPYLANVSMANLDIMSINADGSVSSSTGYVADSRAAQAPDLGGNTQEPDEPEGGETTPSEPAEPTEPDNRQGSGTTPSRPTAPADEPTPGTGGEDEPATPDTPQEPSEPTEPPEPAQPQESVEPAQPAEPAQPQTPDTPAEPETTTDTTPTDNGGE